MENIKLFIDELDGSEHIILTREDGSKVAMSKSTWDELQAKQTEGSLND